MTARAGVSYLIAEVRRLTGAGSTEYTVGAISYFTDDQIEQLLDSRRGRLARQPIEFEHELSAGGGTVIYKHARVGYGWLEGGSVEFVMTDSQGSVISSAGYTLSPEDGFLSFTADQHGSQRFITGWVHYPYKVAYDLLVSWMSHVAHQPDWETDNMKVKRSQKLDMIRKQLAHLKEMAGLIPEVIIRSTERSDVYVEELVKPPYKTDRIPSE